MAPYSPRTAPPPALGLDLGKVQPAALESMPTSQRARLTVARASASWSPPAQSTADRPQIRPRNRNISFSAPALIEAIDAAGEGRIALSPSPIPSLHGLEILRLEWLAVFDRVRDYVRRRNAKRFALQQWVIAQYIWLTGWASQTQYGSSLAIQYPSDAADFTRIHNAHLLQPRFYDWVIGTQLPHHLDDEFRQIIVSKGAR